jgi:hypothetical protein
MAKGYHLDLRKTLITTTSLLQTLCIEPRFEKKKTRLVGGGPHGEGFRFSDLFARCHALMFCVFVHVTYVHRIEYGDTGHGVQNARRRVEWNGDEQAGVFFCSCFLLFHDTVDYADMGCYESRPKEGTCDRLTG